MRQLLQERLWRIAKEPSLFLERSEVAVTLDATLAVDEIAALQADFGGATGFRLLVALSNPAAAVPLQPTVTQQAPAPPTNQPAVEIAFDQIRVPAAWQGRALNPAKLDNAIAQVRRDGAIRPPLTVRRARDGYLLVDGLYRLRAAQVVGLARVAAVVEG